MNNTIRMAGPSAMPTTNTAGSANKTARIATSTLMRITSFRGLASKNLGHQGGLDIRVSVQFVAREYGHATVQMSDTPTALSAARNQEFLRW
jgi:hypothetical protein